MLPMLPACPASVGLLTPTGAFRADVRTRAAPTAMTTFAARRWLLRSLLGAAVLTALAPRPHAQISITEADVRAFYVGLTQQTTFDATATPSNTAALQALAAQTGGGQTWTFTGLTYAAGGTIEVARVQPPQPGSGDPHFATANLIVRIDSSGTTGDPFFSYFRLTGSEFVVLGGALTLEGTLTVSRFTPGYRQPLPYTFGSTWTSESAISNDPPPPFPVETVIREESEVVGWGTLVTPAGSEPALMVRTLDISRSTITIPGLPPIVTVDSSRAVSFDTRGLTFATIFLGLDGQVQSGMYSSRTPNTAGEPQPGANALGLTVSPNPVVSETVAVRFELPEAGPATVRVYDARGRLVATLAEGMRAAGPQSVAWSSAGVPAGVYVVRADVGARAATLWLTVAR